jgi:1,5-anhydro-D-fructose reductase (1,5-anhydro-D-mannitol-forming)
MSIRWGIIGCGDVCEVKSAPALYKVPGSSVSIVMRRDGAKAADFARRHGIARSTSDAQAVIEDAQVDAVYIATPPGSHLEYALRVAEAGKPCYLEKPMARSAAECQQLVDAFARARQPLFVAYYRRGLPRFRKVQELIESGRLGRLLAVSHVYQGRAQAPKPGPPSAAPAGWRESVEDSGGGLFLDLGSHVVDLLEFLLGKLSRVTGFAARRSTAPGLLAANAALGLPEDTVVLSFASESGVLGTVRHQFHTSASSDRLELVGTLGTLSASVFGQEPLELRTIERPGASEQVERIEVEQPAHVHQPLVESIVRQLREEGTCPSTGASALRASAVLDAALDDYYGGRQDAFWLRPETWPGRPVAGAGQR